MSLVEKITAGCLLWSLLIVAVVVLMCWAADAYDARHVASRERSEPYDWERGF